MRGAQNSIETIHNAIRLGLCDPVLILYHLSPIDGETL